ncbi:cytochrome c oxidase assembly protein subunit 15 [Geomicrobium halophilum]|uniref:Heme A synthase n=1 Tax=Geomicrobium halophilum TaxID=549000 RepID=A0A841PYT8_9BACL|nr:heme A synthase [Geomicrobium halophilum]MBB6449425.1 cytochrome c oxidase assembly protein subunit 15 [Geomicrobium halophilum]
MNKGLKFFGIITSIGMLLVLLQGAVVTKTDSGDGCGETWPLCFGELVPSSPAIATLIEYSHRLVSGLVGLLVVILAIWSVKKLSHIRETKFWALMAVLFIIFQGLMGAAAVIFGHSNLVLALHFGISAISFATVVILTTLAFEDGKQRPAPRVKRGFRGYLFFVLAYTYAVIYSGAYVKHTGSTYACDQFPGCSGEFFGFQAGVQMTHRIAAILLIVFLFILLIQSLRYRKESRMLAGSGITVFLLVLIQATAGVLIVFFPDAYIATALTHSLVVSILFTVLCYMGMIVTRNRAY